MRRWQADLTLVGITVIWGGTFVMVKNALDAVGPATFIAWRFIAASLVLLAIFWRRMRGLTRAELLAGALVGLWLGGAYTLQTTGLQFTSTGKTGFITGLNVVMVPLFAAALFRRAPGRWSLVGVVLATVGLGLMSLTDDLRIGPGDLWVLGGAVGFALQIVTVDYFAGRTDTIRLAVVQIVSAALLVTAAAFLLETPSVQLPVETWGAVLFTGIVATALVFTLQTVVQRHTPPTHVALIFSLEPLFAALFGWLLAGETLSQRALVGAALIMAGVIVSELGSAANEPAVPESAVG